jgi:hypothetical protein
MLQTIFNIFHPAAFSRGWGNITDWNSILAGEDSNKSGHRSIPLLLTYQGWAILVSLVSEDHPHGKVSSAQQ